MKVVAFNGSPKVKGNTYHAIKLVSEVLEKEGIEVEIIHVGNKLIRGCLACNGCAKNKDEKCVVKNDEVNEWVQKMKVADGIILGSPVHYSGVAGTMKSFLDRAFYVAGVNNNMFRYKVGTAVAAVRRSGGLPTVNQLNHFFSLYEMIVPTSTYWNVIHGTKPGDVLEDLEGVQIMKVLGENMAYTLKMQNATEVIKADKENKVYTNFIR